MAIDTLLEPDPPPRLAAQTRIAKINLSRRYARFDRGVERELWAEFGQPCEGERAQAAIRAVSIRRDDATMRARFRRDQSGR
jgi:hypothetical protein